MAATITSRMHDSFPELTVWGRLLRKNAHEANSNGSRNCKEKEFSSVRDCNEGNVINSENQARLPRERGRS